MQKATLGKCTATTFTGLFLAFANAAHADATVYWDSDNGFVPSTVVIGSTETVTWWNTDIYGFPLTVTFTGGFNFSLDPYTDQPLIFPAQPGVYNYQSNWGEHGSVIINLAPTVAIIQPANNVTVPAPASVTIQATANDTADDFISDVEFFLSTGQDTSSIEDVFSAPYSTTITNLAAGSYILIAVARDSRGWTATNSVSLSVGVSEPIRLSSPRIISGKFLFETSGLTIGKTSILQASTELASWTSVKTNLATGTTMTITNNPSLGQQFYRVIQLP